MLSKLHHDEIAIDHHRPGQYKPWIGKELNLNGFSEPMQVDDIPKFEKMNNLSINVYTINEKGKLVNPLYCTKNKENDPINLLLIEVKEKSHYTWIKNFNRLLNFKGGNTKVHCPYCCYGFDLRANGERNL